MLSGNLPFSIREGEVIDCLYEKITSGKFDFSDKDWNKISSNAKNLIKKLLVVTPSERPSAQQILDDIWLDD